MIEILGHNFHLHPGPGVHLQKVMPFYFLVVGERRFVDNTPLSQVIKPALCALAQTVGGGSRFGVVSLTPSFTAESVIDRLGIKRIGFVSYNTGQNAGSKSGT